MAMAQARVVALALCALLLVSGVARRAEAVSYNVGNSAGWDLSADLPSWADGKTFNVGDVLGTKRTLATSSPAASRIGQEPKRAAVHSGFVSFATVRSGTKKETTSLIVRDACMCVVLCCYVTQQDHVFG